MSWFLAAGTAIQVVGSGVQQQKEKKAIQRKVQDENNRRSAANLANAVRAGYREGLLNLQEGMYKKAAAQQGFDTSASKSKALSEVSANAAAAGSIGASVDAVAQDIEMRVGEMRARREEEQTIMDFNFELQSSELQYDLERGTVGMAVADVPSTGEIWGNAAMVGATYFASSYASQKMKLGSGSGASAKGSANAGPSIMPDP